MLIGSILLFAGCPQGKDLKPNGEPCIEPFECISGICSEGVCGGRDMGVDMAQDAEPDLPPDLEPDGPVVKAFFNGTVFLDEVAPFAGATVSEFENPQNNTVTDGQGRFSLRVTANRVTWLRITLSPHRPLLFGAYVPETGVTFDYGISQFSDPILDVVREPFNIPTTNHTGIVAVRILFLDNPVSYGGETVNLHNLAYSHVGYLAPNSPPDYWEQTNELGPGAPGITHMIFFNVVPKANEDGLFSVTPGNVLPGEVCRRIFESKIDRYPVLPNETTNVIIFCQGPQTPLPDPVFR